MVYFIHRLIRAVIVIAGVSILVFVITHLIGDPAKLILPIDASEEQYLKAREQLRLDDPLYVQFGRYFSEVIKGDFGLSLWQKRPALPIAIRHLWPTLQLGLLSVGLAVIFGVPAGVLAAANRNSTIDRVVSGFSLLGVSIANFWLSLMLILLFAVKLNWFYTSGYGTWKHIVLPALAASALPFGRMSQISRAAVVEELQKPYITAARAKGLTYIAVILRHGLRNALIPIVTLAGYEFGRIMAGFIVVIETVFAWPGLGRLAFNALSRHDFPLIQASILVIALSVVIINIVVDFSYAVLDPRIRIK